MALYRSISLPTLPLYSSSPSFPDSHIMLTQVSDFKFISTQKLMPGFSRKTYPILSIIQRLFVSSSKIPGTLYRLTAVGQLSDTCRKFV